MSSIISGVEQTPFLICDCCRTRHTDTFSKTVSALRDDVMRFEEWTMGYEAGKWTDICRTCKQAAIEQLTKEKEELRFRSPPSN